ncbi:MAG: crotonobetainyl-CoA:carnitine CoA-transferase CaiB-like acyl-CoA transferase [Gammaproteobacteria bacterium]|jgi:crotonobetainyl-CoA:carnitine CoA-transferase CaiB-like acyl-CoA transferase
MADNKAPLAGIKVVDCSRVLAGPYCCELLSLLGAEVIKVENHGGDEGRMWPPHKGDMGSSFLGLNANKRSIAVDLKTPAGVDLVKDLAREADVLVENFKTGDMERFGLGYDDLKVHNDKLVYTSVSAFGRHGPKGMGLGYEALLQAYSGVMNITGEPGGMPVRCGVSFLDMGTGVMSALATVTALFRREFTGSGGKVEASLLGTSLGLMSNSVSNFLQHGFMPERLGTAHPQVVPYQAYPTKDSFIFIASGNQNLFERLCRALDMEEIIGDPRFKDNASRVKHREAVLKLIFDALAKEETEPLMIKLDKNGVPYSRVNNFETLWEDGQVQALGLIEQGQDPDYGDFEIMGLPFSLTDHDRGLTRTAPRIGEHSREIMTEIGYDQRRIDALIADKIVVAG